MGERQETWMHSSSSGRLNLLNINVIVSIQTITIYVQSRPVLYAIMTFVFVRNLVQFAGWNLVCGSHICACFVRLVRARLPFTARYFFVDLLTHTDSTRYVHSCQQMVPTPTMSLTMICVHCQHHHQAHVAALLNCAHATRRHYGH